MSVHEFYLIPPSWPLPLPPSLSLPGGNCLTLMIANIWAEAEQIEETVRMSPTHNDSNRDHYYHITVY